MIDKGTHNRSPAGRGVRDRLAKPATVAAWRVRVVIPYHSRPSDVRALLTDLAGLDHDPGRVQLSVLVVDNAAADPASNIPVPDGLDVHTLRLGANVGGSGGFSQGMRAWLEAGVQGDPHELLWLLDSDVRLDRGAMEPLIEALDRHPELAGVGSVLADPDTGDVFEAGGEVDRRTGELVQELPPDLRSRGSRVIPAGYLAACSLMVRRSVVEVAGVMADLFISGDDVEWCCRVRRVTGLGFAAVPESVAFHPRPDKMRTWGRYYAARNAFTAMAAAGVTGRRAKFRRAMREVGRAACQVLVGRDDLAGLHLKGLRDAGLLGAAAPGVIDVEPWRPISELDAAVREAVRGMRGRVLVQRGVVSDLVPLLKSLNAVCIAPDVEPVTAGRVGMARMMGCVIRGLVRRPRYGVAVVSARGRVDDWMAGRVLISVDERAGGFAVRKVGRVERAVKLTSVMAAGLWRSVRIACGGVVGASAEGSGGEVRIAGGRRPRLSIVVLSFNRCEALERTLTALTNDPGARGAEVIVVDNASTDGTPAKVAAKFPRVRIVALKRNVGIGAFNEGVRASTGEAVLILDDDAWPDAGVLDRALDVLARRPDVAAVSLHPVHPETRASEWSFAGGGTARERWPVMGCGNLVRRTAWDRVGGYEGDFFLYRNDVDLALKLLGSGQNVYFDPAWVVWHDSVAGAGGRKSRRWFELASRNWVWLCRRHGSGWTRLKAIAAGWVWAHRLAQWSPGAHVAVLRGVVAGICVRRPGLPRGMGGGELGQFLSVRLARGE